MLLASTVLDACCFKQQKQLGCLLFFQIRHLSLIFNSNGQSKHLTLVLNDWFSTQLNATPFLTDGEMSHSLQLTLGYYQPE